MIFICLMKILWMKDQKVISLNQKIKKIDIILFENIVFH